MPGFDESLTEICGSVLSKVLGESGRDAASWWLARANVSLSDCASRPLEFHDALEELLQPTGALVIETRILGRLYRKLGTRYERGPTLSFADEVWKAKELFNEKNSR